MRICRRIKLEYKFVRLDELGSFSISLNFLRGRALLAGEQRRYTLHLRRRVQLAGRKVGAIRASWFILRAIDIRRSACDSGDVVVIVIV